MYEEQVKREIESKDLYELTLQQLIKGIINSREPYRSLCLTELHKRREDLQKPQF